MSIFADSLVQTELDIEDDAIQRGIDRYWRLVKKTEKRGEAAGLKPVERLMATWFKAYRAIIISEKSQIKQGVPAKGRRRYGRYIPLLNSDVIAVIAMNCVLSECILNPSEFRVAKAACIIGSALNAEYNYKVLRDDEDAWDKLVHTNKKKITVKAIQAVSRKLKPEIVWKLTDRVHVGGRLIDLLIRVADLEGLPGIERYRNTCKTAAYLRLSPRAYEIIAKGHESRKLLRPRLQPMVMPPAAWTKTERGGYLKHSISLIKAHKRNPRCNAGESATHAVNVIGRTPWRINKRILEVAQQLANDGGNVAGLPRTVDLPMPGKPSGFVDGDWNSVSEDVKKQWKKEAARIYTDNETTRCESITLEYKLDVARRFQKYERFYFPHTLDFRGRVYPAPLFLNHQGDDLCRGLLEFAMGVGCNSNGSGRDETRKSGHRWLQIHLANVCGVDKIPFAERIAWCQDHNKEISGWAADPLHNIGWMDQEKPFQALAASMALQDPEAAAHLPVQVDGSNNALQHYAAMLRCPDSAAICNLVNSDRPTDVYADVAEQAARFIKADTSPEALMLDGWITRKLVKQPVMTSLYDVTIVGMRKQIQEKLKDAGFHKEYVYDAAKYLVPIVRKSVGDVCVAARDVMAWLRHCAVRIAATGEAVTWESPIGMICEQPYMKSKLKKVVTAMQTIKINIGLDGIGNVRPGKQASGFSPNWVHSVDASHMMRVAIAAHKEGIDFAGVHDSYWGHACNMDRLVDITRQEFLNTHVKPLHHQLYDQFKIRYPDVRFNEPPPCGSFDITEVLRSQYIFG